MFTACEQSSERRLQYFQKKIFFLPNTKNARKKNMGKTEYIPSGHLRFI